MIKGADIAVIGGTGFYEMTGLAEPERLTIETPYGETSSPIILGTLGDARVAFLARHGEGHSLLPSEIPQRANFWALASLGVTRAIAVCAVGSLREDVAPRDLVIPDQIIDHTKGLRPSTFFGEGIVAHVSFAHPFCRQLSEVISRAGQANGARLHSLGTLVVIDGPAFSTLAESERYRSWGASIIGMTALPEAKLAREAGICYGMLGCVTDYDTWHPEHASVTVDQVIANLQTNVALAGDVVRSAVQSLSVPNACTACRAFPQAILTPSTAMPAARKADLAPILERYGIAGAP